MNASGYHWTKRVNLGFPGLVSTQIGADFCALRSGHSKMHCNEFRYVNRSWDFVEVC